MLTTVQRCVNNQSSRPLLHGGSDSSETHSIKDYITLFRPVSKDRQKIFEIRKTLIRGNPIIIRMKILENFKELNIEDRTWDPKEGNTQEVGIHPLIIVSFDEVRQAVEVLNSWGPEWGNRGYIWIKYTDLVEYLVDGFVLKP